MTRTGWAEAEALPFTAVAPMGPTGSIIFTWWRSEYTVSVHKRNGTEFREKQSTPSINIWKRLNFAHKEMQMNTTLKYSSDWQNPKSEGPTFVGTEQGGSLPPTWLRKASIGLEAQFSEGSLPRFMKMYITFDLVIPPKGLYPIDTFAPWVKWDV